MKGVILQPGYFPWLGFFNQMALADVFVYLDDVQYDRRGWRNRNRIKGPGGPVWLTVPVIQKGLYDQLLTETRIDNSSGWAAKHLNTIRHCYSGAAHFRQVFGELEQLLASPCELLIDLDIRITEAMNRWLGITTRTLRASDLEITDLDKTNRLVEICLKTGITEYISGPLCRNYLDLSRFLEQNIRVFLNEYRHPEYAQKFPPFAPYLSCLDLILNEGPAALEILRSPESLKEFEPQRSIGSN